MSNDRTPIATTARKGTSPRSSTRSPCGSAGARTAQPRLRCAVYTRKSTEEGLDQAFNSLDAQREACAAFIASQVGLGWNLVPDLYDDGGISGGTMERPALQRLLQDIRDGQIDVVVVYKIDRLTRSLADFARIVEVFDTNGVSFVSVTQQFNTTTSMGRLTLNVLLSFAQFEREVTAERIRDKIAASKKKGMWMGGRVPLGYRAVDRRLVINEPEADFVRHLFARYLELGSVPALAAEVGRGGSRRTDGEDPKAGMAGQPFRHGGSNTRSLFPGMLYKLLANPLYIGKLRHHRQVHEGEHQSIVDHDLFERVQAALAGRASVDRGVAIHADTHLLTGILFDEAGERMAPTHAKNHHRRYRYYVSDHLLPRRGKQRNEDVRRGWRLPAAELDDAVVAIAARLLRDRARLATWIGESGSSARIDDGLEAAVQLGHRLVDATVPQLRRGLLRDIIQRVQLGSGTLAVTFDIVNLVNALFGDQDSALELHQGDNAQPDTFTLTVPIDLRRRGNQARIVVETTIAARRTPDPVLVDLVGRAHLYLASLTKYPAEGIAGVAMRHHADRTDVGRILPLAFLSPALTRSILTGTQPIELSGRHLSRLDLPHLWADQQAAIEL